jgi:hypothetical protein
LRLARLLEQFELTEEQSTLIKENMRKHLDKFVLDNGYPPSGSEYVALLKWLVEEVTGTPHDVKSKPIISFREFLVQRGVL